MFNPTGKAPSWWRVGYDLAWFAFAGWLTVWVLWGAETDREFVGAILGLILCASLGVQLFAALMLRLTASVVAQREAVEEALRAEGYEASQYKPGPY